MSKVPIPETSKQYEQILEAIENAKSKEELKEISKELSRAEKLIFRLRHRIEERKRFF